MFEGADHHDVDHAADHAGAVLDRLGASHLAVAGGQMHDRTTHLVHAGLKAHPGARTGLLENHRQGPVRQWLIALVVLETPLDAGCALEQVGIFLSPEILELQVMAHQAVSRFHGVVARKALIKGQSMEAISCASAGLMISAGTNRITRSAVTLISKPAAAA